MKKWNELSDDEKKAYNVGFANDIGKYKQDLAKWELKMIRLGNVDLVRQEALIETTKGKPSAKPSVRKTKDSDSD